MKIETQRLIQKVLEALAKNKMPEPSRITEYEEEDCTKINLIWDDAQ